MVDQETWLCGDVQSRASVTTTSQEGSLAMIVLILCFLLVLLSTHVQLAGKLYITVTSLNDRLRNPSTF